MREARFILLFVSCLACAAIHAQRYSDVKRDTMPRAISDSASLELAGEPRVIKVRKPVIRPYVKIDYMLYLAQVRKTEQDVYVDSTLYRKTVYLPDSTYYPESCTRIYPQKSTTFSRTFSENINFSYLPADTPRIDTMYVDFWITDKGKMKWVEPDTSCIREMPGSLGAQLVAIAYGLEDQDWGTGGGFKTPGKFLSPAQFRSEYYYCRMRVIVSSRPLTVEQKNTGALFAPFDMPLNSPPADTEQESFMRQNITAAPGTKIKN